MAELLKGKPIAKEIKKEIKRKVALLKEKHSIEPKIAVMLVAGDSASALYSSMIIKNCTKNDIKADLLNYPNDISRADFIKEIEKLNNDNSVHGIIIMQPLPVQIDEKETALLINPLKDVDGVNPVNAGKLLLGEDTFVPNTAQACKDIINYSNIETEGKHVVVLGRSNIVGKPLANLMLYKDKLANSTVTVCHSRSKNLQEVTKSADILVAAIGRAEFVTKDFVAEGQVVIDVGMNEKILEDGSSTLAGDVKFEEVAEIVAKITPVPGGMSPLTHTALMNNIIKAALLQNNLELDA